MINIHQGVDIVGIPRFRDICIRHDTFIADIFTEREFEYCRQYRDMYTHLAGRFAAKEACLKALGTGISAQGIDHIFRDMEVLPDASGRPWLSVSGWLSKIAKAKRIKQFSVSISHSAGYAVATAILVGDPQPL